MHTIGLFLKKNYRMIIGVIISFFLAVSLLNAWNDAATFDEVAHIPAGYSYLVEHDYRLNPEHPPLIKALAGIPLLFLDLRFDTTLPFWTTDVNGQWDAGKNFLYAAGNNADTVIFWSRTSVVFLSVAFGIFLFAWGRRMGGILTGLFALTLYALDPSILGHNHYVTTDLGSAATIALTFFFFLRFLKNPTWRTALWGGLFLGIAQLTKFSAVILFPFFGFLLLLYVLTQRTETVRQWGALLWSYVNKGIVAIVACIVVIWIGYVPFTIGMPEDFFARTIDFYVNKNDTSGSNPLIHSALTTANDLSFLRPMAAYALGVVMVFQRVEGGNGAYFFGEVSDDAFPAYFPIVFLIKETLPHLLLYATTLIVLSFSAVRAIRAIIQQRNLPSLFLRLQKFTHRRFTEISLILFVVFYVTISVTGNLNIGFRHLFPIMPFLFLLTATILSDALKKIHDRRRTLFFSSSLAILFFFLIVDVAGSYPFYLSYFNQTVGGPLYGYHYVTDSNADWGQDLKRLKIFLDRHSEIEKIRIDYFGGGNIVHTIGEQRFLPWWDSKRPIEEGWYAISTNFLQGSIYDGRKTDADSYRWISHYQPRYRVGTSILIYFIDADTAENANKSSRH